MGIVVVDKRVVVHTCESLLALGPGDLTAQHGSGDAVTEGCVVRVLDLSGDGRKKKREDSHVSPHRSLHWIIGLDLHRVSSCSRTRLVCLVVKQRARNLQDNDDVDGIRAVATTKRRSGAGMRVCEVGNGSKRLERAQSLDRCNSAEPVSHSSREHVSDW
ncbi:hypothetical protein POSPLADRAFT_1059554 [Postia placenta MAD-698-R-SB12]|uniref:Uncharacterized protein n=1 Tax=Postia placenta MAD-698-R-SB12 TaxID=670580 RepID=A0A1X6MT16_9APHY|nr:hypothetical protein POSPLADRAFT_1059554 [Postia placenta MAD-698-R-SB12]OSX59362.1 hypothetical protein POSPLADRAFT_1059554 [Postia placenta MAD-698-R-SB12]